MSHSAIVVISDGMSIIMHIPSATPSHPLVLAETRKRMFSGNRCGAIDTIMGSESSDADEGAIHDHGQ